MSREKLRRNLLKYTRQAYHMLPQMDKPRILDIGCGSGIPTLELAALSNGNITGIDIDQPALDEFNRHIKDLGLSDRVKAINCSMFEMDFPEESFDIIWAEGSIYTMGFERGLKEWKRLLKPGGFMMIHDEQGDIEGKLKQIADCGYELLGYFTLSKETWWEEYFAPLQKWVTEAESGYKDDPKLAEELKQARSELDTFNKYPDRNSSICFVMKKG